jgi:hypothetical protein
VKAMKIKTKFEIVPQFKTESFDNIKGWYNKKYDTQYQITLTYSKELDDKIYSLIINNLTLSNCPDISEENDIIKYVDTFESGIDKETAKEQYNTFKQLLKEV